MVDLDAPTSLVVDLAQTALGIASHIIATTMLMPVYEVAVIVCVSCCPMMCVMWWMD